MNVSLVPIIRRPASRAGAALRLSALLVAATCVPWAGTARAESDVAVLSADINADGTADVDSGLASSTRSATGTYLLIFARKVSACSLVGAPRGSGGGQVSTSQTANPKRIRVKTFSKTGQAANLGFTVIVNCAPVSAASRGMALLYAQVGTFGDFSGAGVVAVDHRSTGAYAVTFNRPVLGCGYAATAGLSTPVATPSTTAQLSVSPLAGDNASVIVRRDNSSGVATNGNFYVTVICAQ
jgi:hypothetical protein